MLEDVIRAGFGSVQMSRMSADALPSRLTSAAIPGLVEMDVRLRFDGTAGLDLLAAVPADRLYSVGRPYEGRSKVWGDRVEVDTSRTWLCPDVVHTQFFDDVSARFLNISRLEVQDYAGRASGGRLPEVVFRGWTPITLQLHDQWGAVFDYVRTMSQVDLDDPALVQGSLKDMVLSTLLTTFPNTFLDYLQEHPDRDAADPASVRRAIAFMDEHLGQPVGAADIAAAAQMSARGLQQAFQRARGTTPLAYLRSARLAAARRDLLATDPAGGSTVATTARRWGFAHLGRFAGQYRDAFGESPSQTLRR